MLVVMKIRGVRQTVNIWPDTIQNTEITTSSAPKMTDLCQVSESKCS